MEQWSHNEPASSRLLARHWHCPQPSLILSPSLVSVTSSSTVMMIHSGLEYQLGMNANLLMMKSIRNTELHHVGLLTCQLQMKGSTCSKIHKILISSFLYDLKLWWIEIYIFYSCNFGHQQGCTKVLFFSRTLRYNKLPSNRTPTSGTECCDTDHNDLEKFII